MTDTERRESKRRQLFDQLVREAQEHVDFANEFSVKAYMEYVSELRSELIERKEVVA